jgi:heptosyltransferase-3
MASAADKIWPAAKFVELAGRLKANLSLDPVFIAGPDEDLSAFQAYRSLAGSSVEDVKRLLAGAALFIGNDSGPAHMAAAFGIPSVVLFGSSDPDIWRPWKTESIVLTDTAGIQGIRVSAVLEAIDQVLSTQHASLKSPRQ